VAPPRPYWKGYLKLSLVACPIALYTASSSGERVAFRQINKRTGNRLRQQLVDDVTREPVEAEDKGRGYEVAKNSYILVEDEELDAVAVESNHTIEIDQFVPRDQIDDRYLDSPYYIISTDQVGQEAFAVIREAMRDRDMAALGRVVLAKRERVIMLRPWDKGLMGTTLRYPYEVRDAADYFGDLPDVKVPGEMLKLAEHILDTKAADFDPSTFRDRYEEAVVDLLKHKEAGMPAAPQRSEPGPRNVINLMDALRRSVAQEQKAPPPNKGKAKKGKKRIEGQREMLLPIPGKRGEKEAAKKEADRKPARPAAKQRKVG
jgi:DNA end-binding protein Ku